MNLNTLTMDRNEARKAFLEYRNAVRARHNDEDEQIMRCYRALANGNQVIDLKQAITSAGVDSKGRPRLAVMRADKQWCYVTCFTDGGIHYADKRLQPWQQVRGIYRFGPKTLSSEGRTQVLQARSVVPSIPPQYRPKFSLTNYEILWEAEWQRVPVDPALLKHLGGNLYAVLAMWDLTEVERAVLAIRKPPQ